MAFVRETTNGSDGEEVGHHRAPVTIQPPGKFFYQLVRPELTAKLEERVKQLEAQGLTFHDWVLPGSSLHTSALDLTRTVCRRAERRICTLQETNQLQNSECLVYLNRLSDLLWLLARWGEQSSNSKREEVK